LVYNQISSQDPSGPNVIHLDTRAMQSEVPPTVPDWALEEFGDFAPAFWALNQAAKASGETLEVSLERFAALFGHKIVVVSRRGPGRPIKDCQVAKWNNVRLKDLALRVACARSPERMPLQSAAARLRAVVIEERPDLTAPRRRLELKGHVQSLRDALRSGSPRGPFPRGQRLR
jgi:hypothetical protein